MRTLTKILWCVSGILLVVAGILALVSPTSALLSLSVVIGAAMLLSGAMDIVVYCMGYRRMYGAGWLLADGIITVLLSLFLLFNQVTTAAVLPYLFGMWLVFSGIGRTVSSFDFRRIGMSGWGWMTALGILGIVVGFISMFNPIIATVAIGILFGVLLIVNGAQILTAWGYYIRLERFWRNARSLDSRYLDQLGAIDAQIRDEFIN